MHDIISQSSVGFYRFVQFIHYLSHDDTLQQGLPYFIIGNISIAY